MLCSLGPLGWQTHFLSGRSTLWNCRDLCPAESRKWPYSFSLCPLGPRWQWLTLPASALWLCPQSHSSFITSHIYPFESRVIMFLLIQNSKSPSWTNVQFMWVQAIREKKGWSTDIFWINASLFLASLRWSIGSMSHTPNLFSKQLFSHTLGPVSWTPYLERLRIFQITKCWLPFALEPLCQSLCALMLHTSVMQQEETRLCV